MAKVLAREATIKTVSVEIKALTVSGRQVTLALFRQLQEEALIDDETIQLVGVPWGRVNYHTTECSDEGEHLHVVWQKGDELRRSCVASRRGLILFHYFEQRATRGYQAAIVLRARDVQGVINHRGWDWKVTVEGMSAEFPEQLGKHLQAYWAEKELDASVEADRQRHMAERPAIQAHPAHHSIWQDRLNKLDARLETPGAPAAWTRVRGAAADYLPSHWEEKSVEECLRRQSRWHSRASVVQAEWDQVYRSLEALDQLFIAT